MPRIIPSRGMVSKLSNEEGIDITCSLRHRTATWSFAMAATLFFNHFVAICFVVTLYSHWSKLYFTPKYIDLWCWMRLSNMDCPLMIIQSMLSGSFILTLVTTVRHRRHWRMCFCYMLAQITVGLKPVLTCCTVKRINDGHQTVHKWDNHIFCWVCTK